MSDSAIPSIRTFQMDASTVGVLKSSVNLFRGDVNVTQNLFSMPGRSDNDGLQIDVSIQYQSNVYSDAMTWNRDRPTGVLGLGWTLPLSMIAYESGGSPIPGAGTYSISMAGVASQLIQEPATPLLFVMNGSLASQLVDGQPVPAAVRSEFVQRGLPLSATATVSGSTSPWTLQDDEREQTFTLIAEGGELDAYDGGESYQLANYKFWKVIYYPSYERWAVTNDAGQVMSFGGGLGMSDRQYKTSAGNSVEWGVRWVDGKNLPIWEGASGVTQGQQQYARAWHLRRAFSRFGESVEYGYNEFPDADGLLMHGAEQLVGAGGKPYTKACYLTSVTDVFRRRATLTYRPKLWSAATQKSPREYSDPHKAVPDTKPNGYQDRYETQYLDNIVVTGDDGTTLFSIQLEYDPSPDLHDATRAVANVAGGDGDTCKRFLTGYTLHNPAGDSLPGYRFDYCLDTSVQTNLGALSKVTWPTGGTAAYHYEAALLDICERRAAQTAPAPMPADSIPRVWFGPDYAVVIWGNTDAQKLSLQIVTWTGQWNAWQPDPSSPLLLDGNGGTDVSTVNVLAGADFVAVTYETSQNGQGSTSTNMHLFRKDPARRAQWVAAEIRDGGAGGCNQPTWVWNRSNGDVSVYAGDSFVLVTQMSTSGNTGSYDLFTWNWSSRTWTRTPKSTATYTWFAVGREYFSTVDMQGNVDLRYLTPTGAWRSGGTAQLGIVLDDYTSLEIASGVSMLAVSHLISGAPASGQHKYEVFLLQWNSDYSLTVTEPFTFTDTFDKSYPISWAPQIIANTLVAVGGNLIRYDGQSWLPNSALRPTGTIVGQQRYAYGPDYAVLVQAHGSVVSGSLLGYDPNNDSGDWSNNPSPISGLVTSSSNQNTANWVAADNPDFLVIGTQLYFRGVATNWQTAIDHSLADIQTLINQAAKTRDRYELNSASVINEGPAFIACASYDNEASDKDRATATSALLLRNGNVLSVPLLSGEQMWTAQESDGRGSGMYPGGPAAFCTYPDSAGKLNDATTLYLHRYAGDEVQGRISDWPVSALTVDDGLSESFTTTYVQNSATAACDPSGEVVKYYDSIVYPGGSRDNPVNGSVVSKYLNGATTRLADYYDMLDGLLESVAVKDQDGNLVTENRYSWNAYADRAADPTDAGKKPVHLYGAYVLQGGQSTTKDGVTSSRVISYTPGTLTDTYTGQPASITMVTMNGAGVRETDTQTITHACEVNPVSRVLNDLSSVVQNVVSNNGITTAASVTALTSWPTVWGNDVLTLAEEADFGWTGGPVAFPFGSYAAGDTPSGWQMTTRIAERAPDGIVLQQCDGAGTVCATTFAAKLGLPVATFKNATLAECAWNGFQSYEDQRAWTLTGTRADTANAWLGTQSLSLPEGASVSTAVTPAADRTAYLLALRYRTPSGYASGNADITVTAGEKTYPFSYTDTGGQWRYLSVSVALPTGARTVALKLSNSGNGTVLIDSALLVPFGTNVTIRSWWPDTRLMRAAMDEGGSANFTLYDNFRRPLGALGPDGTLQELDIRFLSRQGNTLDAFDDTSPNAELTAHFADGGNAETFLDGDRWMQLWRPGNAALWSASAGLLTKSGNAPDSLTWQGAGSAPSTAAIFLEMIPLHASSGALSIEFGGGQTIAWAPGVGWSWSDDSGATVQAPLANPPSMAAQWLLVFGEGVTMFFADGQLMFSHEGHASPTEGFIFRTGPNPLRITNLMSGATPRLGLSYTDGASRQRQLQQLWGKDSRVAAMIYDALDRQIATTRAAPGRFAEGANRPLLRYSPTFVDVQAFLDAQQSTWAMTGDVADYYAGQIDGPIVRSDDQDYPYSGMRYEASPLNRVVESGQPGLRLSIHDVDTTTPAQRKTTRTAYGASVNTDPLPAGQYFAADTTSPGGYRARGLVDTAQRAVAAVQFDQSGTNVGQSTSAPSYRDTLGNAGTLGEVKLPNAYTNGPQKNSSDFVRKVLMNPLGQASRYEDPDSGSSELLFNGKGQQRFIKVPLERGEQYFLYTSYDALGRTVEEGFATDAWNPTLLVSQVDNLAYPTFADGAVPARRYSYDGDGDKPQALGRLTRALTYNPAPAADPSLGKITVDEQWEYDELGRVKTATLSVSGALTHKAAATYHYNAVNEIVRIDYPEGSPLPSVTYRYDDQGQVVAIGVPGNDNAIASYTWSADGQLQTASRGSLAEVWNYDSPGNIVQHQVCVGSDILFGHDFEYTDDSLINTRLTTIGFSAPNQSAKVTYAYDGQQRLRSSQVSGGQGGNQAISQYDANGNIWSGSQDGAEFSAACADGTDQLANAALPDGREVKFHYRTDGCPDQWRGLGMEYDPALDIVSAVSHGNAVVRYARGINNQRVVRQQGSDAQIVFQGAGNTPLAIWVNGKMQICIWGPDGMTAVHNNGTLHYPIVDHQGTVWVVTDGSGQVQASYDYLPFGGILTQSGSLASDWLFRYGGKQWDAELELYDFGARLYDPALLRFTAPDSARQYSSPYVFAGNNPINLIDPSGNMSLWGQVGIGAAMAGVCAAGLFLSFVTFGAAAAPTGAAEAALAGAATAGEAAATIGGEAAATAGAEAGAIAADSVTVESLEAAETAELAAGASSNAENGVPLLSAQSTAKSNLISVAWSAGTNALQTAGSNGFMYDVKNGRNFTAAGFFKAMGVGALSGAVYGGVGGLASMPATVGVTAGMSITGAVAFRAVTQAGAYLIGSDLSTLLSDAVNGQKITTRQLLWSSVRGLGSGVASGAFGGLTAINPEASAVGIDKTLQKWSKNLNSRIDQVLSAAKSVNARCAYAVGGCLLTTAYECWGLARSHSADA